MLAALAPPLRLLLLASAVVAQVQTPSVVTFQSISPVPTSEGVFTIQTSVPGASTTVCYEVCVQAPCPPCAHPLASAAAAALLTLQRRRGLVRRLHGHLPGRDSHPGSTALKRGQFRAAPLQHRAGQPSAARTLIVWQCAASTVDFSSVACAAAATRPHAVEARIGRVGFGPGWRSLSALKSWGEHLL
jgi:hypothetical protein